MAHPQLAPLVAAMDSHRDELVLAINNAAAPANPAAIQAAVTAAIAPLQAQLGAIQAQMLGGFAQMRNATRGEGIASPWEQVPNQQGQLPAAAHPAWPLLTNLGTLLGLTNPELNAWLNFYGVQGQGVHQRQKRLLLAQSLGVNVTIP